jgi:hypothetical protein
MPSKIQDLFHGNDLPTPQSGPQDSCVRSLGEQAEWLASNSAAPLHSLPLPLILLSFLKLLNLMTPLHPTSYPHDSTYLRQTAFSMDNIYTIL